MKVYCKVMETKVELKNGDCSLRLGSGDGTLTAGCPMKYTRGCLIRKPKRAIT